METFCIGEKNRKKLSNSEKKMQRRERNEMGLTPEQANSSKTCGCCDSTNSASPERISDDDINDCTLADKHAFSNVVFCKTWKDKSSFNQSPLLMSWEARKPEPSCQLRAKSTWLTCLNEHLLREHVSHKRNQDFTCFHTESQHQHCAKVYGQDQRLRFFQPGSSDRHLACHQTVRTPRLTDTTCRVSAGCPEKCSQEYRLRCSLPLLGLVTPLLQA